MFSYDVTVWLRTSFSQVSRSEASLDTTPGLRRCLRCAAALRRIHACRASRLRAGTQRWPSGLIPPARRAALPGGASPLLLDAAIIAYRAAMLAFLANGAQLKYEFNDGQQEITVQRESPGAMRRHIQAMMNEQQMLCQRIGTSQGTVTARGRW